jgi:hypothetical protein
MAPREEHPKPAAAPGDGVPSENFPLGWELDGEDDDIVSQPHPTDSNPSFDPPPFLRFFNEGVEVDLRGRPLARSESRTTDGAPAVSRNPSYSKAKEESDSDDDLGLDGKTTLWGTKH